VFLRPLNGPARQGLVAARARTDTSLGQLRIGTGDGMIPGDRSRTQPVGRFTRAATAATLIEEQHD